MVSLGRGCYGDVTHNENEDFVTKQFITNNIFHKEIFYLSYFHGLPHICEIIDYDIDKMQIRMKKYDMDLYKLSKTIPFSKRLELINDIVVQLLLGLREINSRGIVHLDICLDNIFCNYDSENNKIKCFIGDFSITTVKDPYEDDIRDNDYPNNDESEIYEKDLKTKFDIWCVWVIVHSFLTLELSLPKYTTTRSFDKLKSDFHLLSCDNLFERFGFELIDPLCEDYIFDQLKNYLPEDFSKYIESNVLLREDGKIKFNSFSFENINLIEIYKNLRKPIDFPEFEIPFNVEHLEDEFKRIEYEQDFKTDYNK